MHHRVRVLTIGALVLGLAATDFANATDKAEAGENIPQQKAIILDFEGKTPTPAPKVKGARTGGQVEWLQDGSFEHLDPQQIYVSDALSSGTNLFHRTLTAYKEDPNGGPIAVVGDLATNAGKTTDGGKTWTYTLRDGVTFEDGAPVTSRDIAYGISRSFSPFGDSGPHYIQSALDPDFAYRGPYENGQLAPGLSTPDNKTLVITFPKPQPEFPYWAAHPVTTPVPEAKDTRENYETEWVSSGPYKRKEYQVDSHLLLERNPNWDPKSDPLRHQYPDTIKFTFTSNRDDQTHRLIASRGTDAAAIMASDVSPDYIDTVAGNPRLRKRVIEGNSPYAYYLNINTTRVTDVDVRRALNYAFDRDAAVKNAGGGKLAEPSTTIMSPVVPGYKNYDAYPAGPNGDVAKAKALLEGKPTPALTFCFANTVNGQKTAALVRDSFEREGMFQIVLNPIDRRDYYSTIGRRDNTCDLMTSGWGQDLPDGDGTLGVLMDGSMLAEAGNTNYSLLNEPTINAKLKELREMADRTAAGPLYGALDEQIMRDYAPVIPTTYSRHYSLVGTKIGGAYLSPLYAQINLTNVFVKA